MNGIKGKIIRFFISFAAIGIIVFFMRDKLHDAMAILRHEVQWGWVAAAAVGYAIGLALIAIRLQWVFRVQEIHITFLSCYYLGFVGLFYNLFLPSAVGGDVAKAYYAYKHSGKKIESATSIFLDRVLGFIALIVMAFLGLLYFSKEVESAYVDYAVYGAFGFLLFFTAFFASRHFARLFKGVGRLIPSEKWKSRLAEVYHAIYGYRHHHWPVFVALLLSFISQAVFITTNYWLAVSLGANIVYWKFFILIPVIGIVSMAPSIGGLGVREASVIYLFSRYLPPERALALTVLMDILTYSFSFGAGIVYAFRGGLKKSDVQAEIMR
ncbi:MAG TPA: lysylphosphatidylglycerol synthase transmembrane domain-containing protein [Candidatus Omnitrophota bacterium]|nr:lysylphosphatidylglycerol synthase transmembrane domain-containing protein [Candidatus Omnitrophota bacterium]